jgi:hypothetical protein
MGMEKISGLTRGSGRYLMKKNVLNEIVEQIAIYIHRPMNLFPLKRKN